VEEIRTAIFEHGAVATVVAADNNFMSYQSGIFDTNTSSDINHLVVLVGYDNNQGYWILRNSWGTGWGEQGYMRIKYGMNQVGSVATYVQVVQ
jgi:C1A family cysteine protease